MCPDIMSTGFAGAESGGVRIGDTVAVFAQGPIGLCATVGAKLMGATTIIAVETRAGADRHGASGSARTTSSTSGSRTRSRRSCASPGHAASTWRSRRSERKQRSRRPFACLRPGGTLVEPGRLFRCADHPARRVRGRPRRPQDRHDAVPGRKRADAAADERDRRASESTRSHSSRIDSSSTRSSRRTSCSPASATAYSRSPSRHSDRSSSCTRGAANDLAHAIASKTVDRGHLKVRHSRQLFDGRDPAPFRERDLDEDAVEYFLAAAHEIPRKQPLSIVVTIRTSQSLVWRPT